MFWWPWLPQQVETKTASAAASDWQKAMEASGYKIMTTPLYKTETGGSFVKPDSD